MDSKEYTAQCEKLLGDQTTYTDKGPNNPTKTKKGSVSSEP